jgi:hypothetical protein
MNKKVCRVHRLVAQAWLPTDPDPERTDINHKDGIKTNFSLDNLEWCTPAENSAHAHATGLRRQIRGKAIESFDDDGNTKQYDSMFAAGRELGVSPAAIRNALDKPHRRSKGLGWRTIEPLELPEEEWAELLECDGYTFRIPYSVSSLGRVRGVKGLMKAAVDGHGYEALSLAIQTEPPEMKTIKVHRLIATVFLGPAPSSEHMVFHKDNNKSNNAAANLSWELMRDINTSKRGKPIEQRTLEGEHIKTFQSIALAAEEMKVARGSITSAMRTKGTCAGYRWGYAQTPEPRA